MSKTMATGIPKELKKQDLLKLYESMVLLRQFESTAQEFYRSGRWPGFIHLYIGEEATAVGVCANLRADDWITSTHRGHGHALAKGVPARNVMAELLGKATGCSGGRGGSMHMYCPSVGLLGTTGVVASGIPVAVGAALSAKVRGTDQVAVAFFGDGATSHGAFLESINFATVQKLPVVFVCENNLYATQTAFWKATANTSVAGKAPAFGCLGVAVDGNDVLAVWKTMRDAVARARAGEGPTLIEALTYRWCGHSEGDPPYGDYRSKEEVEEWKKRCPIAAFRRWLVEQAKLASAEELAEIEKQVAAQIQEAIRFGDASPDPDPASLYQHVYAEPINPPIPDAPAKPKAVQQSWLDAVRDGIAEEMRRNPNLVVLGEGIAERGGCFGHTKNLWKEFGAKRVIDTPICELAFTGAAAGASATGCRAISDVMFADFLFDAAGPIVHMAAKLRYMSNGAVQVPMVIRAPMGMLKNTGAHHGGSYYPVWAHIPGLIVVTPADPADAKGLIKTALRAGDPVIFLEHKGLFSMKALVPEGEHLIPMGRARVVRPGTDLTVVSCSLLLHRCVEAAQKLQAEGISCEVIDLRTIVPLDVETVVESVRKTGRLLVVDEAWGMFGVGAELAAAMMEHAFDRLDAPVARVHTERVSLPFSPSLDGAVAVTVQKIVSAAKGLLSGQVTAPLLPKAGGAARQPAQASAAEHPAPAAPARPSPAASAQVVAVAGEVLISVPNMGLTTKEVTVKRWLKNVGDSVQKGEAVMEVDTDKVVVEIEAPASGTIARTVAQEGDVVEIGKPLGVMRSP